MTHLPLQHQRLDDSGIVVSRSRLSTRASRAIDQLEPICRAQNANALQSRVLAGDEASIKAGRKTMTKGKMRTGWFWPVYGDSDEIVLHFAPSREHRQSSRRSRTYSMRFRSRNVRRNAGPAASETILAIRPRGPE